LAHNAVEKVTEEYIRYQAGLDQQRQAAGGKLRTAEKALNLAQENEETPADALANLQAEKNKASLELAGIKGEQKKVKARIDKLRKMGGAVNCLGWAHRIGDESLSILSEEFDRHPWLLACPNGVLDLRTAKFSPGRPDQYLLRHVAVPWLGMDSQCPVYDAFFDEIHFGDKEVTAYLDRLFGYSLTGLTTEHFIGFFLGEGRNGKGTLFEMLRYIMGDLGWSISPELLLEQKNARNSAGPSPDLWSLMGRRVVIASESDDNRRVSLSQVKRLTGGDTILARQVHGENEANITPTWKLFFYTNHVPPNIAKDFSLQQRLVYLKYPLKFVENPDPNDKLQRLKDIDLPTKLRAEASGILARLVRGCLQYQEMGGLHPPAKIRADIDDLAKSQDTFQLFFAENVKEDSQGSVTFKRLYEFFSQWYTEEIDESGRYQPTKKAISTWLERHGYERRKPSGVATVYGLQLVTPSGGLP